MLPDSAMQQAYIQQSLAMTDAAAKARGIVTPSAIVEVVDSAPPPQSPEAPWWKDPMKLGLAVVAGALLLTLIIPRRS